MIKIQPKEENMLNEIYKMTGVPKDIIKKVRDAETQIYNTIMASMIEDK